jgi:predicted transcriptional regulator
MNFFKALRLATYYNKANRLLKKGKAKAEDVKECDDKLKELIVELEEDKLYFTNEIKKIKSLISKLSQKLLEV